MPRLTALRAFEAAARHESFSRAAQELLVSHAAISRQIRQLEEDLAVQLFERTGNRVVLTRPGRDFLTVLTSAFDSIAAAAERLVSGRRLDRLVLSVDPGLATRWLNRRLEGFQRAEPGIDIEIIPSLELAPFPNDLIDAAVHYGFDDLPARQRSVRLISLEAFPVCSPKLLEGERALRVPADLAHHRLLHEQDTTWWRRWLTMVGGTGVDWSKGTIYRDSSLVLDAAVAGQGVAIGDNLLPFEELEAGDLVKPFARSCPSGTYYLVKPEPDREHPALATFEAWLVDEFAVQTVKSTRWAERPAVLDSGTAASPASGGRSRNAPAIAPGRRRRPCPS